MTKIIKGFVSSDLYIGMKDVLETISFLVAIIGIIAIFISILQLKNEQKKLIAENLQKEEEIEYRKKEKSIEVLSIFANDLIPQMDNYISKFRKELEDKSKLHEIPQDKKKLIIKIVKKECGAGYVFNQLEHICLYISAGLVNERIIYEPLHKILVDFVNENKDIYEDLLKEAPYKYLTQVYNRWSSKIEYDALEDKEKKIAAEKKGLWENIRQTYWKRSILELLWNKY